MSECGGGGGSRSNSNVVFFFGRLVGSILLFFAKLP